MESVNGALKSVSQKAKTTKTKLQTSVRTWHHGDFLFLAGSGSRQAVRRQALPIHSLLAMRAASKLARNSGLRVQLSSQQRAVMTMEQGGGPAARPQIESHMATPPTPQLPTGSSCPSIKTAIPLPQLAAVPGPTPAPRKGRKKARKRSGRMHWYPFPHPSCLAALGSRSPCVLHGWQPSHRCSAQLQQGGREAATCFAPLPFGLQGRCSEPCLLQLPLSPIAAASLESNPGKNNC